MTREFLMGKVHRPTVTGTRVDYEGSLTLDASLMQAAGMRPYERIDVYNSTSGTRFSTYLITGEPGSGEVCVNGAAARLVEPGDRIIIASYASLTPDEIPDHRPTVVLVDRSNRIREIRREIVAGTVVGADA